MASKVAIITGAASGIGLAVTENFVSKGWNVAIGDINLEAGESLAARLGSRALFIRVDVTRYSQQAKLFHETWKKWGRIDFVHANAGIADRVDFFSPKEDIEDGAPPQPDSLVVDVDLYGVIWSSYLALHYFRKDVSGETKKLLITASSAGLYPLGEAILYSASKHGAIGLCRALGRRVASEKSKVTVNCLCPGIVPTNIVSAEMIKAFPQEMMTPLSVIVKVVNTVISDDFLNGAAIECNGQDIQVRDPPPFLNEAASFTGGGGYHEVIDPEDFIKYSEKRGM